MQEIGRCTISFFSYPEPVLENQLTKKEKMEEGSLRWSVYHHYIQAAGGTVCQLPHARPGALSQASPVPGAGTDWNV